MKSTSNYSEHTEQRALVTWAALQSKTIIELASLFSVPNGAYVSNAQAGKLKSEGLRAGVPDLFLAIPRRGFAGMFIEMKRVTGGVVSEAQKEWHQRLAGNGYHVVVCKGFDAAKEEILNYLKL
jgi:hypothetical protein